MRPPTETETATTVIHVLVRIAGLTVTGVGMLALVDRTTALSAIYLLIALGLMAGLCVLAARAALAGVAWPAVAATVVAAIAPPLLGLSAEWQLHSVVALARSVSRRISWYASGEHIVTPADPSTQNVSSAGERQ